MDNMREVILSQYKQITHSLEVNKDVKVSTSLPAEQDFDSIILCGMGGSGHPGDLLNALSLHTVPLYVHRNYNLPADYLAGMNLNHPLVIASSYSGNTEETLTAYQAAQKKGFPLLGSAAGGTLKEWAKRDGVPFSSIDYPNMQPRHTLFAAFTGIYRALKNSGLAPDITSDLKHTAYVLAKITPDLESPAKKLAHAIKGKVPVYNSSDSLGFAAKNFKIQTNENAKYPGFWNTFPELNHNELIGFSKLKESQITAQDYYYEMQRLGFNYRLTDIQCALGISQLKKLDIFLERRKSIADYYNDALRELEDYIIFPPDDNGNHAWHLYVIQLKTGGRDEVFKKLRENGIGVQVHYIPVYFHPYYRMMGYKERLCPHAEDYFHRAITLPLYPSMDRGDMERVVEEVFKAVKGGS